MFTPQGTSGVFEFLGTLQAQNLGHHISISSHSGPQYRAVTNVAVVYSQESVYKILHNL